MTDDEDGPGGTDPAGSPGAAWLDAGFERARPRLTQVAARILRDPQQAEDAVQETWLRLHRARSGRDDIVNLEAWLTTVTSRVCLDMLKRRSAGEVPTELHLVPLPEPDDDGPAAQAALGDSVSEALGVVLDALSPEERLAFVLHDVFGLPFAQIAPAVGRSVDATKMLTSRARRRVRRPGGEEGLAADRRVVAVFLDAARRGDLEGLVRVLHPDVELHVPAAAVVVTGAEQVASRAATFATLAARTRFVLAGTDLAVASWDARGAPVSLLRFEVADGAVVRIESVTDAALLGDLFAGLGGPGASG